MKKIIYQQFRGRPKKHYPPFPSAYCTDYMQSNLAEKEYSMRLHAAYVYDAEKLYSFVEGGARRRRFDKMLVKKFIADPNYLDKLVHWSEKRVDSLRDYIEENFKISNLKRLSNKEVGRRYIKYISLYRLFHLKNTPPWWLASEEVERELQKEIKPGKYGKAEAVFNNLISGSEYPTESFLEEISSLDICIELQKKGIRKVKSAKDLPLSTQRLLAQHIKNFSSIPFGYNTGILWDEKHFFREINKNLEHEKSAQEVKSEKLLNVQDQIFAREKFEKEQEIPKKITSLAHILRQLAYLQELKKAAQTRSHPHLVNVVYPEIARRTEIKMKYFGYLSHFDIKKILEQGKLSPEQTREFEERVKSCVVIMKNLSYDWLYGKKVEEFLASVGIMSLGNMNVKELKGQVACKGRASGKVSVCLHSTEIKKVKTGDVLVASMTTPDFVPAMKKAVAIITDEGGITSHAAIISRELGKPCIIGTKIATKVLKDGDLVEVDADAGVVKIIKKG